MTKKNNVPLTQIDDFESRTKALGKRALEIINDRYRSENRTRSIISRLHKERIYAENLMLTEEAYERGSFPYAWLLLQRVLSNLAVYKDKAKRKNKAAIILATNGIGEKRRSKGEIAGISGVTRKTIREWEKNDLYFREIWEFFWGKEF